ncbi:MAG TPA: hypothetical protein DCE81_01060 [Cytophagales bacterium]|nr:hypothetical protein [Cytophagales bacterium]
MIGKIELVRYKFPEGYREVEKWILHVNLSPEIKSPFLNELAEPKAARGRCLSVALCEQGYRECSENFRTVVQKNGTI